MMKRRCLFEKTVRFLITGSVIAAVAVGFYLIGYETAYDRVSVHICASFQSASSLHALKESVYDPVKIWLLFFQHVPDSLGRTPKLLLKSMIEVGHAVVPNGSRYLLHRHIALL